jgi:putative peptide maturation system protein
VQEALLILKLAGEKQPDLMDRIVDEKVAALCVEADPPEVSDEELQSAADAFRAEHGLFTPESMRRRLQEWGITALRFEHMLLHAIQRRKLRERATAGQVEPYFEAHRSELDRLRVLWVSAPTMEPVSRIADSARESGLASAIAVVVREPDLDDIQVQLGDRLREELPPPFVGAWDGLIAPFEHAGRSCLAEILGKAPARLDARTRDHVERRLFRRFLDEKREAARVQWHWL